MRKLGSLGVCLLFFMVACSGPRIPLSVGVKDLATDVVLGGPRNQVVPPPALIEFSPGAPILPAPLPDIPKPAPSPIVACPAADPLAAPKAETRSRPSAPPAPGVFAYRNLGTYDGPTGKGAWKPISRREVKNVVKDTTPALPGGAVNSAYTYDLVDDTSGQNLTTTFRVVPTEFPPRFPRAGIFLVRRGSFQPQPEIMLMQFPAEPGQRWGAGPPEEPNVGQNPPDPAEQGTDPITATTETLVLGNIGNRMPDGPDADNPPMSEYINPKVRVDACGQPLDAWVVELRGTVTMRPTPTNNNTTADLTYFIQYAIGLQYGGLILAEHTEISGRQNNANVKNVLDAVINSEPKITQ